MKKNCAAVLVQWAFWVSRQLQSGAIWQDAVDAGPGALDEWEASKLFSFSDAVMYHQASQ